MNRLKKATFLSIIFILIILILSACSNAQDSATQAIETYIHALSDKDSVQISTISCADWEEQAQKDLDSLTSVGSQVENLSCKQIGQDGADTLIACTGTLSLDYDGEIQEIDLSTRTYISRQEDGEWRMCGYR